MLYKFINENEIRPYKNGFIILDNKIYTNPSAEIIAQAGYKEVVEEELPEYNIETQYLTYKYVDGDVITKTWIVNENIVEEVEEGL